MALFGIHQGSWGLPELSITEKLSDLFGGQRNYQGGSEWQPEYAQPQILTQKATETLNNRSSSQGIGSGGIMARGSGTAAPINNNANLLNTQQNTDQAVQNLGPSDEELNAIYNPLQQGLDQQLAGLQSFKPEMEQSLLSGYDLQKQNLAAQQGKSLSLLGEQTAETEKIKANAMDQARRAFSEIQQGIANRFGNSSSAGGAYSEILGRSAMETMGNVQENYTLAVGKLQNARRDVDTNYNLLLAQANKDYEDRMKDLKLKFFEEENKIKTQKGILESERAARKLDLAQQVKEAGLNIASSREAYQQQIQQWLLANHQVLDQGYNDIVNQLAGTFNQVGGYNQNVSSQQIESPFTGRTNSANSQDYTAYRGTFNPNMSDDELKKLYPYLYA